MPGLYPKLNDGAGRAIGRGGPPLPLSRGGPLSQTHPGSFLRFEKSPTTSVGAPRSQIAIALHDRVMFKPVPESAEWFALGAVPATARQFGVGFGQ